MARAVPTAWECCHEEFVSMIVLRSRYMPTRLGRGAVQLLGAAAAAAAYAGAGNLPNSLGGRAVVHVDHEVSAPISLPPSGDMELRFAPALLLDSVLVTWRRRDCEVELSPADCTRTPAIRVRLAAGHGSSVRTPVPELESGRSYLMDVHSWGRRLTDEGLVVSSERRQHPARTLGVKRSRLE